MLSATLNTLRHSVPRQVGSLASAGVRCKHTLPDLPYDYGALEPHVSAKILEVHHGKHHQTYVNNLNAAEEKLLEAQAKGDAVAVTTLAQAVKFNGGGHINHSILWQNLSPNGGGEPTGELADAIKRDFGSFDNMKTLLSNTSVAVQGSGWGWLGYSKATNTLQIAACPNQDLLEPTTGLTPIFCIDVWEHAYYLQYKNVRPDFVKAIWNVVNWSDLTTRFNKARGK